MERVRPAVPRHRVLVRIAQRVNLLVAHAEHLVHAAGGRRAEVAQVVLVDKPGPVGAHERAAGFDERAQLFRHAFAVHVEHRRNDKAVRRQIRVGADDVDADAEPPKRLVMGLERLLIAHRLARAARLVDGPLVFAVQNQRNLRLRAGLAQRCELFERFADLGDFTEHARIRLAVMVDDGAVEFLVAAAALAPLEILHRIRPVRDGLHRGEQVLARRFQAVDLFPVDLVRRILHEQKRLALQAAHVVVRHRRVNRDGNVTARVRAPRRVAVPRDEVERIGKLRVVEVVVKAHQVRRDGQLTAARAHGGLFPVEEIDGPLCHKPVPVNGKAVQKHLAARHRRLDLRPVRVRMAPKSRPICRVERIEGLVLLL